MPAEHAELSPAPLQPDLDPLATRWQVALDAAGSALASSGDWVPADEISRRRTELGREREHAAAALAHAASAVGAPVPWLSPVPVVPAMLGLPPHTVACVFDVDGVLTDSGALHAMAWGEVLDAFLLRLGGIADRQFIPFDRDADYHTFIEGRPRLEGIHAFLDSRGISLPEGRFDDPPEAATARGLARRKGAALERVMQRRRVTALDGARRYLEAAGRAGLGRVVVSASANAMPMLQVAGLAALLDEHVDGNVIRTDSLRSRPAPDVAEAACRLLGAEPERTVAFTHTSAGVASAAAAGVRTVGIGTGRRAEVRAGFGAQQVVPSLASLLDPMLAAA